MKIIKADWELRNLGVLCQEAEIEAEDLLETIKNEIKKIDATYVVVKAPVARPEIYSCLMEHGFSFIEASIRVSYKLKELVCPKLIKRLSDEITYREMNNDEISIMKQQIGQGMFKTDRVSLDPMFSKEQAARRYVFWMLDEKKRGSKLLNYIYKDQPVGFSCMKEVKPKVFYPVLGGVYLLEKTLPIGGAIIYKQLEIAKEMGGIELFTYISSNNPAVMRSYSQLGYTFDEVKYVFIKHN